MLMLVCIDDTCSHVCMYVSKEWLLNCNGKCQREATKVQGSVKVQFVKVSNIAGECQRAVCKVQENAKEQFVKCRRMPKSSL